MRFTFCGLFGALALLLLPGVANGQTTLVLYPTNPDHQSDGKVTGTLNGQTATFEFQHTYRPGNANEDFYANYVRFAADGPVNVQLTVSGATKGNLRTVGKDLPFTLTNSTFYFTLPGPGNYYLQLPDLNTSGVATYTVFFFFDGLTNYNAYQQEFASAVSVTNNGVVSNPTLDQTAAIQSVLNNGGSIYFPPGIYRSGQLTNKSGTTVYLAPGAVLKAKDQYTANQYLYAYGRQNVTWAGLGTIDVNFMTNAHGFNMELCTNLTIDDVIFRNSVSWMLHIRRSTQVHFQNLKLFSGKDGMDPDGSSHVLIEDTCGQSVDDGFAVKSKFSGYSCSDVTMRRCIVFSIASSLKIGTEDYYGSIHDITWDNCDAVDADRGCILYVNSSQGVAPETNITWMNIRVFNYPWKAETGGAPFIFRNDYLPPPLVTNLLVQNVVAYPTTDCQLDPPVSVTFSNVTVYGSSSIPTNGVTFAGVIWTNVVSQSRPVVFISPSTRNQNEYMNGDTVTVTVQHPYGVAISQVLLLVDGQSVGTDTSSPYNFTLSGLTNGVHHLQATAIDANGKSNNTAPLEIEIIPATAPLIPPAFSSISFQEGGNVIINGSGGTSNGAYYVLSSLNAMLSLTNWTAIATNHFDGSGNFSFTNAVNPAKPVQFFDISVP